MRKYFVLLMLLLVVPAFAQEPVGSAHVAITPGAGLDASTYNEGAFVITNDPTSDLQIERVTIDLGTTLLPDMVFDPTGAGGDKSALCFTPDDLTTNVGLVLPAMPCQEPFSQPYQGGYRALTVDFTNFDPGETFSFSVDVDPNSIKNVFGAGQVGSVSGYELLGGTVTIHFSDGSVVSGSLLGDGSVGGSVAFVSTRETDTPQLQLEGIIANQALVYNAIQTAHITGAPGQRVNLYVMPAQLRIASRRPAFNVSDATFYANEALAGGQVYSAVLDAEGQVTLPFEIGAENGLYYVAAVSNTFSNSYALRYEAAARVQLVTPMPTSVVMLIDPVEAPLQEVAPLEPIINGAVVINIPPVVEEAIIEIPVEEIPIEVPTEVVITEAPTEVQPTDIPTEAVVTEAPTEAEPTDAPIEVVVTTPAPSEPTDTPTEVVVTEAPTEEVPTEVVVTQAPTDAPTEVVVTEAPTEAEPTNTPTEVVVTEVPTEVFTFGIGDFVLVNADSNEDIMLLVDEVTFATGQAVNIRAETFGSVSSVVFTLTGDAARTEVQSAVPYALFSDNAGDYAPWRPVAGRYYLTATAYSGANGTGEAGGSLSITFYVTDTP